MGSYEKTIQGAACMIIGGYVGACITSYYLTKKHTKEIEIERDRAWKIIRTHNAKLLIPAPYKGLPERLNIQIGKYVKEW